MDDISCLVDAVHFIKCKKKSATESRILHYCRSKLPHSGYGSISSSDLHKKLTSAVKSGELLRTFHSPSKKFVYNIGSEHKFKKSMSQIISSPQGLSSLLSIVSSTRNSSKTISSPSINRSPFPNHIKKPNNALAVAATALNPDHLDDCILNVLQGDYSKPVTFSTLEQRIADSGIIGNEASNRSFSMHLTDALNRLVASGHVIKVENPALASLKKDHFLGQTLFRLPYSIKGGLTYPALSRSSAEARTLLRRRSLDRGETLLLLHQQKQQRLKKSQQTSHSVSSSTTSLISPTDSISTASENRLRDNIPIASPSRKTQKVSNRPSPVCRYCFKGNPLKKTRSDSLENLVACSRCGTQVHPKCMPWSTEIKLRMRQESSWLCTKCKVCCVCQKPGSADSKLCATCLTMYHSVCSNPVRGALKCPSCEIKKEPSAFSSPTSMPKLKPAIQRTRRKSNRLRQNTLSSRNCSLHPPVLSSPQEPTSPTPQKKTVSAKSRIFMDSPSILKHSFSPKHTTIKKRCLVTRRSRELSALCDHLSQYFTPSNPRQARQSRPNNSGTQDQPSTSASGTADVAAKVQSARSTIHASLSSIALQKTKGKAQLKRTGSNTLVKEAAVVAKKRRESKSAIPSTTSQSSVATSPNFVNSMKRKKMPCAAPTRSLQQKRPYKKPEPKKVVPSVLINPHTKEKEFKVDSLISVPLKTGEDIITNTCDNEPSEDTTSYSIVSETKPNEVTPSDDSIESKSTFHIAVEAECSPCSSYTVKPVIYDDSSEFASSWGPYCIHIGDHVLKTMYYVNNSPSLPVSSTLFVCERCLERFYSKKLLTTHKRQNVCSKPSDRCLYRRDALAVFEVNMSTEIGYYEKLNFLASLVRNPSIQSSELDDETDTIYVVTVDSSSSIQTGESLVAAYFGRSQLYSFTYPIVIMPSFETMKFQRFIIDFSYSFSKLEGKPGSPNTSLLLTSEFGLSFHSYWMYIFAPILIAELEKIVEGNCDHVENDALSQFVCYIIQHLPDYSLQTGIEEDHLLYILRTILCENKITSLVDLLKKLQHSLSKYYTESKDELSIMEEGFEWRPHPSNYLSFPTKECAPTSDLIDKFTDCEYERLLQKRLIRRRSQSLSRNEAKEVSISMFSVRRWKSISDIEHEFNRSPIPMNEFSACSPGSLKHLASTEDASLEVYQALSSSSQSISQDLVIDSVEKVVTRMPLLEYIDNTEGIANSNSAENCLPNLVKDDDVPAEYMHHVMEGSTPSEETTFLIEMRNSPSNSENKDDPELLTTPIIETEVHTCEKIRNAADATDMKTSQIVYPELTDMTPSCSLRDAVDTLSQLNSSVPEIASLFNGKGEASLLEVASSPFSSLDTSDVCISEVQLHLSQSPLNSPKGLTSEVSEIHAIAVSPPFSRHDTSDALSSPEMTVNKTPPLLDPPEDVFTSETDEIHSEIVSNPPYPSQVMPLTVSLHVAATCKMSLLTAAEHFLPMSNETDIEFVPSTSRSLNDTSDGLSFPDMTSNKTLPRLEDSHENHTEVFGSPSKSLCITNEGSFLELMSSLRFPPNKPKDVIVSESVENHLEIVLSPSSSLHATSDALSLPDWRACQVPLDLMQNADIVDGKIFVASPSNMPPNLLPSEITTETCAENRNITEIPSNFRPSTNELSVFPGFTTNENDLNEFSIPMLLPENLEEVLEVEGTEKEDIVSNMDLKASSSPLRASSPAFIVDLNHVSDLQSKINQNGYFEPTNYPRELSPHEEPIHDTSEASSNHSSMSEHSFQSDHADFDKQPGAPRRLEEFEDETELSHSDSNLMAEECLDESISLPIINPDDIALATFPSSSDLYQPMCPTQSPQVMQSENFNVIYNEPGTPIHSDLSMNHLYPAQLSVSSAYEISSPHSVCTTGMGLGISSPLSAAYPNSAPTCMNVPSPAGSAVLTPCNPLHSPILPQQAIHVPHSPILPPQAIHVPHSPILPPQATQVPEICEPSINTLGRLNSPHPIFAPAVTNVQPMQSSTQLALAPPVQMQQEVQHMQMNSDRTWLPSRPIPEKELPKNIAPPTIPSDNPLRATLNTTLGPPNPIPCTYPGYEYMSSMHQPWNRNDVELFSSSIQPNFSHLYPGMYNPYYQMPYNSPVNPYSHLPMHSQFHPTPVTTTHYQFLVPSSITPMAPVSGTFGMNRNATVREACPPYNGFYTPSVCQYLPLNQSTVSSDMLFSRQPTNNSSNLMPQQQLQSLPMSMRPSQSSHIIPHQISQLRQSTGTLFSSVNPPSQVPPTMHPSSVQTTHFPNTSFHFNQILPFPAHFSKP